MKLVWQKEKALKKNKMIKQKSDMGVGTCLGVSSLFGKADSVSTVSEHNFDLITPMKLCYVIVHLSFARRLAFGVCPLAGGNSGWKRKSISVLYAVHFLSRT